MKKLISKIFAFFAKHFDSMRSSESVSISDYTTSVPNVANEPNVGSNENTNEPPEEFPKQFPEEFPDSDLLSNVSETKAGEISKNGSDAGASIQAAEGDAGKVSLVAYGNPLFLRRLAKLADALYHFDTNRSTNGRL
ncbi:MAG: hypothetical protein ACOX3T_07160 [Bdellovibrionota bacterium]